MESLDPALDIGKCAFLLGIDGGGQLNIGQCCRRVIPGSLKDDAIHFAQRFRNVLRIVSARQIVLENIEETNVAFGTGLEQRFASGAATEGRAERPRVFGFLSAVIRKSSE